MERDKILTFRVRQLPLKIGEAEATKLLQQVLGSEQAVTVHVYSLATSLTSLNPSLSQTATITVVPLPSCLKGQREKTFKVQYEETQCDLTVDVHFLDFTVLNKVNEFEHCLE